MKVSVIILTIDGREEMLKEAFNSVCNQTVKPYEIIIITGKEGVRKKWNKGIVKSEGDAFIPLCDDDKLDKTYIEKTTGVMKDKKADIVGTALETFGIESGIHRFNETPPGTSLIKKSIWKKVGGYDENIGVGGDSDLFEMCKRVNAKIEIIPEPLLKYRQHKNNWSKSGDWEESNKYRKNKYENINNNTI